MNSETFVCILCAVVLIAVFIGMKVNENNNSCEVVEPDRKLSQEQKDATALAIEILTCTDEGDIKRCTDMIDLFERKYGRTEEYYLMHHELIEKAGTIRIQEYSCHMK